MAKFKYLGILLLLQIFSGYGQAEERSGNSLKTSLYAAWLEGHDVEGLLLATRLEYLKTVDANFNGKQGYELILGRSSTGAINYDDGGTRPSNSVFVALHSNWYYDVAPEAYVSPLGMAGAGFTVIHRIERGTVLDFYPTINLGAGLRFGRPWRKLNFLLSINGQLGLGFSPNNYYYSLGYQMGVEYRFKNKKR